jgi:hypothetical protein
MRKEYGKALRQLFTERLREELPEFDAVRITSRYLFPGERAFRWVPQEPLHCWIILSPDGKGREAFRVEIGWSLQARFPELSMRPSPIDPSDFEAAAAESECVIRVASLRQRIDAAWELPDPGLSALEAGAGTDDVLAGLRRSLEPIDAARAHADVSPLVDDAIAALRDDGMPFLHRLVAYWRLRM